MSYYKEQRRMSLAMDGEIRRVISGDKINISRLILELTSRFEIGEKAVLRRIQHYKEAYEGLREEEGMLVYREG